MAVLFKLSAVFSALGFVLFVVAVSTFVLGVAPSPSMAWEWSHLCDTHTFGFNPPPLTLPHVCDGTNSINRPCYYYDNNDVCDDCYKEFGVRSCTTQEKADCGFLMELPGPCGSDCKTAFAVCGDGDEVICSSEDGAKVDLGSHLGAVQCTYDGTVVDQDCYD